MKKRLFNLLLICVLSFSLCACGKSATEAIAQTEESTEQQTAQTEETTTEPTATPEPTVTEEPTPEPTTEPTTETTAEPQAEPTAEPTTETTAETTPEPEPQAEYTYTDMSATMYAQQSVNVRDLPDTSGNKLGGLSANQEITVTGQCNETSWYRIEYNGETAYVSDKYLSDTAVEVAQSNPATPAQTTSAEPCPYTLNVWTPVTTEYGMKIYVIYHTQGSKPNDDLFGFNDSTSVFYNNHGAEQSVFVTEMVQQASGLCWHYVYPTVKVGTYAEGIVYKTSAGVHYTTGSCPNHGTGLCQPGTID